MKLEERISIFDRLLGNEVTNEFRDYLMSNGFFTAPASTKYHGNYAGGLFDHSFTVTKFLESLTKDDGLTWQRATSPYIVGMFHDICKIDYYKAIGDGKWEHNTDTVLKGHGDKSVMLLSTHMRLTEEEMLCIRYHMGAFTDKEEWNLYTRAVDLYPNVLWTHHADMLASHVAGI